MSDILKAPVYEGRPKLGEGRLEKEIRTYDLLDRLAISYLRLDHEAMLLLRLAGMWINVFRSIFVKIFFCVIRGKRIFICC